MADSGTRRLKRSRSWHRARWREHVLAQGESGLSAAAYCREHGLKRRSFYRWRAVFRAAESGSPAGVDGVPVAGTSASGSASGSVPSPGPVAFAELRLPSLDCGAGASGVEVVLAGERRLRLESGFDEDTLRRAVVALEVLPC